MAGDRLYVLDQAGEAFCLDAARGKVMWRRDLMREPGLDARPAWFFGGSPLVLDNAVVFAAGTAGIALEKESGKVAWSTGPDACGSASPLLFEQGAAKWRTWTDSTGRHTVEAKFGGMMAGKVKLTKKDGATIQLLLEKLSDEDQKWIENRKKSGDFRAARPVQFGSRDRQGPVAIRME